MANQEPNLPPSDETEEQRAARIADEPDPPKAEEVPKTPRNDIDLTVRTTKPIEQSLRKIKAKRVPHRSPIPKGAKENGESNDHAGHSPDAGVRGTDTGGAKWTILPVDWFRTKP